MKKFVIKFTSALLALVVSFSGVFVFFASADNSDPVYCVSDHFSKLKYNYNGVLKYRIPQNEIGTCTHVAMSMLLSFYDFYWNDSFVPTIYSADGISHQMGWENGVYNSTTNLVEETFNAYPESSAWENWGDDQDFEGFAAYNEIYYLQPYLMNIANNETINNEIGITGLLDCQVVDVLEEYLSRRQLGSNKGVTVHIEYGFPTAGNLNATRDTLFETIKTQINNGNPVIFLGLEEIDVLPEFIDADDMGIYAHAMIAYDVVGEGAAEDILLHTGWNGDELQHFSTTPFQYLNSAIWLEIDEEKLPHQCVDKYYDIVTGDGFCACEVYADTHPGHICTLSENYTSYTSSGHYKSCVVCGKNGNVEYHNCTFIYHSSTQHQAICLCGYIGYENHGGYTYTYLTSTRHKCICKCGYESTSAHVVSSGGGLAKRCIDCGGLVNLNDGIGQLQSVCIIYITDNGSYIRPDGIIVLSEIDTELYLSGVLDLDSLTSHNCNLQ